jgi:putative endonuclease
MNGSLRTGLSKHERGSEKYVVFWVYILRCSDGSYYTGHTDNLEKRIAEHKSGEIPGYTSTRRPVELVFEEVFQSRDEALASELRIKGWSRKKKEALIRGDWAEVRRLAAGKCDPSRNNLK